MAITALSRPCRQVWTSSESKGGKEEDHGRASVYGRFLRHLFRRSNAEDHQAGFPFFQLDRFLKILVQELNESVAISEEFANTPSGKVKSGGLLFNRKITRIVTPGTLIDEKFINPYENNYLLAISASNQDASGLVQQVPAEHEGATGQGGLSHDVGLAWLDLSTGDFYTQSTAGSLLPSAIARIGAREIVLDSAMDEAIEQQLLGVPDQQRHLVTRHNMTRSVSAPMSLWTPMLESSVPSNTEKTFTGLEIAAGNILLEYVREKLLGSGIKLQPPVRKQDSQSMSIDKNSLRGLEILETAKDGIPGGKGSLLHAVRRTVTKGGARMLKDWIGKLGALPFYLFSVTCPTWPRKRVACMLATFNTGKKKNILWFYSL